jgi:hypothetical protein
MRHIVICGLSRSTIFSTLSHKRYDFRVISCWTENVCFDSFVCNIFHVEKNSARYYHKCVNALCEVSGIFSAFKQGVTFWKKVSKKYPRYQISWTFDQWEPCYSTRNDGQTNGHDEANRLRGTCHPLTTQAVNVMAAHMWYRDFPPEHARDLYLSLAAFRLTSGQVLH